MSEQKDALIKLAATADPTSLPAAVEGSMDSPAMSLTREQYVSVSSGGAGVVATVIDAYVTVGPVTPGNALLTASVVSGADGDGAGSDEITRANVGVLGADHVSADGAKRGLFTVSALYAQFQDDGAFDGDVSPIGAALADVDDFVPGTCVQVQSYPHGANGTDENWDRLRTASAANISAQSGLGAQLAAPPGEWSINHTPAANTQATITRAAGGAGVRHVCKSITATLIGLAAAAEATVLVNLRDGATGAGTILWSARLLVQGTVGNETSIALSNLNIVGSAATEMTLEFSAAGGANTFETVALTGFDAA